MTDDRIIYAEPDELPDDGETVDDSLGDGDDWDLYPAAEGEWEQPSSFVLDAALGAFGALGAVRQASPLYTHPTEGWTLRGDAAASYLRMRAAGMPKGGVAVFLRLLETQRRLYANYKAGRGPVAAFPNPNAPHVRGAAMDLTTTVGGKYSPSAAFKWLTSGTKGDPAKAPRSTTDSGMRAHGYGWRRTVPSERWHFGYDPARDTKAAADLVARLRGLGYGSVGAFQKAEGLTVDNKPGPITWARLLSAKAVDPVKPDPKPSTAVSVKFRVGQANLRAERFGGLDDEDPARPTALQGKVQASVYAVCETPEATRKVILGKLKGWKTYPVTRKGGGFGMVAVMWDAAKFTHHGSDSIEFAENGIHGAVRAQLKRDGIPFDVISLHVRPNAALTGTDAQKLAAKRTDIGRALKMVRDGIPTIVAGDFNTKETTDLFVAAGFTRLTDPKVSTLKTKANDPIDQIWIRGGRADSPAVTFDLGKVSDHLISRVTVEIGRAAS